MTYDDYNDDMEKSAALREQVETLEAYIGMYNTVKGSLMGDIDPGDGDEHEPDFSEIEFFGENASTTYDIDSTYINLLLETYAANNQDIREEIEKALQKLNKSTVVKEVYREILNAIDTGEVDENEDVFVVKRRFFTQSFDQAIQEFADTWFVSESELHLSAIQYEVGTQPIPNIRGILESKQFTEYKKANPKVSPLKYGPEMKRQWTQLLDEVIVPLGDELR